MVSDWGVPEHQALPLPKTDGLIVHETLTILGQILDELKQIREMLERTNPKGY